MNRCVSMKRRLNAGRKNPPAFEWSIPQNPGKNIENDYKGQLISKANCQAVNSSKKRTNEFVFTSEWFVFVHFLGES